MAQDVRTPDFDDLLAAFDIPDVPSISVKEEPASDVTPSSNNISNKTTLVFKDKDEKSQIPTSKLTLGINEAKTRSQASNASNRPKLLIPNVASISKTRLQLEIPDMTYQLSTNVLPPYIPEGPPPDKLKISVPFDGYKCLDCGDQFLLESSLKQHLERRSVYISLNCETCQKVLIYYNRCILLNHVRNHRDKNQPCDVRKADVAPLPRELMNVIPLHMTLNGVVNGIINNNNSNVMLSRIPPSVNLVPESRTSMKESKTNNKLRCSECCQFFDTASLLGDHFSRSQNMPLATSQCTKCNMTCPSKCSLSAHQRIHLQTQPFTCPECGIKVSDNWISFQQHLSILCLHYSRSIGYKCSICSLLHIDGESLRQHIINIHSEVYFKCQACPMAFKAGNTFETHKKTSHLTMDVECKMIFKCPLCDTVFHSGQQLDEHLDIHIKEQIRATKFVFKCLECGKLTENKMALGEHVKQVHPQVVKRECCNVCGLVLDSKDNLISHTKQFHNNNDNNDNGKNDVSKSGLITYACSNCDMSYYNLKSLVRHERMMHNCDGRQKKYVCWICKEHGFTKRTLLEKHFKLVHANEMVNPGTTRPPIKIKIPRQKMAANQVEEAAILPQKQLRVCTDEGAAYTCFKCDYVSNFRSNFVQHISVHKTDRGSLQCCECGACFVVAPALRKHLSVVHRVRDVDGYLMEKDECPSDGNVNGANGLECGVCFNSFSNELSLKTHMRTHGMAFIRSKTSENSLNCS